MRPKREGCATSEELENDPDFPEVSWIDAYTGNNGREITENMVCRNHPFPQTINKNEKSWTRKSRQYAASPEDDSG